MKTRSTVTMFPAEPTATFRELARFIDGHRLCGTLMIHAPDCDSAVGFLIALECDCGAVSMRWITVEAAFQDVVASPWLSTSN